MSWRGKLKCKFGFHMWGVDIDLVIAASKKHSHWLDEEYPFKCHRCKKVKWMKFK